MAMMPRQITPMFKPNSGPPEEIVIEDDNDSPVVISQRRVVRPPAARGRGGRRGRPRLDPDTDLGKNSISFSSLGGGHKPIRYFSDFNF